MLRSILLLWRLVSPHLRSQRSLLMGVLLLTFASTACGLLAPWLAKRMVDSDVTRMQLHTLLQGGLVAGGAYLMAYGFWAAQQALAALVTERIFVQVKNQMLQRLLDRPRSFFDRLPDSEIVLRLNTNLRDAAQSFREDIMAGAVEAVLALSVLGTVLFLHVQAGLMLALALCAYAGLVWAVDEPLRNLASRSRESRSSQNVVFLDILAAARDIKVFNLGAVVQARFGQSVQVVAQKQGDVARFSAAMRGGFSLFGAMMILLLVIYCGWLISTRDPRMSVGLLVVLLTVSLIYFNTLNQILMRINRLVVSEPSLRRVVDMMAPPAPTAISTPDNIQDHLPVIPDDPTIEFVDVHYTLAGGPCMFSGFNLKIEVGEKVAIMGPSGSGKSLLLDLLMRLREPAQGQVLYSGIDIARIPSDLYYSAFGFVGQNGHLMRLSLREFLRQGWPGQRDEDLWAVLDAVKLGQLVRGLPQQLATVLGPDGWTFAAGQRQRLMLARALLRDPQVLLLDEFTGSLDEQTEADLLFSVLDDAPRRTVICITHSARVAGQFERVVNLRDRSGGDVQPSHHAELDLKL